MLSKSDSWSLLSYCCPAVLEISSPGSGLDLALDLGILFTSTSAQMSSLLRYLSNNRGASQCSHYHVPFPLFAFPEALRRVPLYMFWMDWSCYTACSHHLRIESIGKVFVVPNSHWINIVSLRLCRNVPRPHWIQTAAATSISDQWSSKP